MKGIHVFKLTITGSWKTSQLSYKKPETIPQTEGNIILIPRPFLNAFSSHHRPKRDLGDPSPFSFLRYRKWGHGVYISGPESRSERTAALALKPTRDCSPWASRRLLAASRLPPSWPWLSLVGIPTGSASPSICEPGTPDLPGSTQREVCVVRLHDLAPVRCWWLLWGTRDHCLHSCLVRLFCVRWADCSGVLRNFRRSPNHSVCSMMLAAWKPFNTWVVPDMHKWPHAHTDTCALTHSSRVHTHVHSHTAQRLRTQITVHT